MKPVVHSSSMRLLKQSEILTCDIELLIYTTKDI